MCSLGKETVGSSGFESGNAIFVVGSVVIAFNGFEEDKKISPVNCN